MHLRFILKVNKYLDKHYINRYLLNMGDTCLLIKHKLVLIHTCLFTQGYFSTGYKVTCLIECERICGRIGGDDM